MGKPQSTSPNALTALAAASKESSTPAVGLNLSSRQQSLLLLLVLCTAMCAIFYELLISSLLSHLLGSSVLHFSITVGLFMFFMGVGSYLSRFFQRRLLTVFVTTEILIGLLGGLSALLLQASYSYTEHYYLTALLLVASISTMVGLEIPLVTRLLGQQAQLATVVASVFAADYLGALIASICFPLLLLPYFGNLKTALLIGLLNLVVAALALLEFRSIIIRTKQLAAYTLAGLSLLATLLIFGEPLVTTMEQALYQDVILFSKQSRYQRIVLTQFQNDLRLFLNGNIQFSSADEYRYHEPLAHLPVQLARTTKAPWHGVILGGGDGLLARELLKYPHLKKLTIVDLDPEVTKLATQQRSLRELNQGALLDQRVEIIHQDAFTFIRDTQQSFDLILADLPDPNDFDLGKLYSHEFYQLIKRRLAKGGIFATQATSPYYAREAFWCIAITLEQSFKHNLPLRVQVPAFGEWGFHLASEEPLDTTKISFESDALRFLTTELLPSLLYFDKDTERLEVLPNLLRTQQLVRYYESGWERYN